MLWSMESSAQLASGSPGQSSGHDGSGGGRIGHDSDGVGGDQSPASLRKAAASPNSPPGSESESLKPASELP